MTFLMDVIIESMDIKENQQSSSMCIKCQSFFGSEATARMCSQCYKKHGTTATNQEETITTGPVTPLKENREMVEGKVEQRMEKAPQKQEILSEKVNKDRCATCSRKLRLLGIECRCGSFFCNSHRLPQDHKCGFNHKEMGKEKLSKQIVKVQNGKIESI